MAHATRPGPPGPSIRLLGCLAAALLAAPAAESTPARSTDVVAVGGAGAGALSMSSHMQVVEPVSFDPESVRLPSVQIDPIRSALPLDDRFDADAVFDLPFCQALHEGLVWYLSTRGVRVVQADADVRLAAAIEGYEGWRRPGRWGASITLRTRLYHHDRVVATESLQALLRYPHPAAAAADLRQRYQQKGAGFTPEQVLFTRIGLELGNKMLALLGKDAPGAVPPAAVSTNPGLELARRTLERGVITIEAGVDHAEVLIDGQLVGTTPLVDLNVAAGPHVLEVRRPGYRTWKRQIHVIERAASRFFAEMEEDAGTDGGTQ